MKRILDCKGSDFKRMDSRQLKQAIQAAEGRTILSEIVASAPPLVNHVSNAEIAKSHGADLILLNLLDVTNPYISGIDDYPEAEMNPIAKLKSLTGLPVGINLEPVDPNALAAETLSKLPEGRIATKSSVAQAVALGVDFICLTGNPKTGVTNEEIAKAVQMIHEDYEHELLIIAGKMHSAGAVSELGNKIISENDIDNFAQAGCDVLLLPAPGTVPGVSVEYLQPLVSSARKKNMLTMGSIGTSQEGAERSTIRDIALFNKMAGFDVHHIGDAGYEGIAVPENIEAYSTAIRGRRHTLARKASSAKR